MNCPIEEIKNNSTQAPKKKSVKQLRISPDEKAMLSKLSKSLKISESEAIRRMIKATYQSLMSDCA